MTVLKLRHKSRAATLPLSPLHSSPVSTQTMFSDLSRWAYLYFFFLYIWNKTKDYQDQHLWDFKPAPTRAAVLNIGSVGSGLSHITGNLFYSLILLHYRLFFILKLVLLFPTSPCLFVWSRLTYWWICCCNFVLVAGTTTSLWTSEAEVATRLCESWILKTLIKIFATSAKSYNIRPNRQSRTDRIEWLSDRVLRPSVLLFTTVCSSFKVIWCKHQITLHSDLTTLSISEPFNVFWQQI